MPDTPAYCDYLIAARDCTGGGYCWGLREDVYGSKFAAQTEIGCIDAPHFLAGGATEIRWKGEFYALISVTPVWRDDAP